MLVKTKESFLFLLFKKISFVVSLFTLNLCFTGCSTANSEQYYLRGLAFKNGVTEDFNLQKSFFYLNKAAKNDHINAHCLVADAYHRGSGVKQSVNRAIEHYKACTQKREFHTFMTLGYIYFEDLDNPLQALSWYYSAEHYGSASQKKAARELQSKMEQFLTSEEKLLAQGISEKMLDKLNRRA